jgi:hypothetical protein
MINTKPECCESTGAVNMSIIAGISYPTFYIPFLILNNLLKI